MSPPEAAILAVVYVTGVLWGLFVIDARTYERAILALLWPVGPAAFLVTLAILLMAIAIAFPLVGIPLVAAIAAGLWWVC